jgi:hypothetical protein
MLSRCANSQCGKPFLRLREGKLFLVETDDSVTSGELAAPPARRARPAQRHVEHYWLCEECTAQWTLIYTRESGVALAPLRRPAVGAAPAAIGVRNGAA